MTLKFELEEDLENKFREAAMKKFGYSKGSLQKASKEALGNWVMTQSNKLPKAEDPFKLVEGILGHLRGKKTSVQLQHEARDLWK